MSCSCVPKTPNCLPGARDQVPALFQNVTSGAQPVQWNKQWRADYAEYILYCDAYQSRSELMIACKYMKTRMNIKFWKFDHLMYVNTKNWHAQKTCVPLSKHACKNAQLINDSIITIYLFNHVYLCYYSFMNWVLFYPFLIYCFRLKKP